jgi:hypothetical protein
MRTLTPAASAADVSPITAIRSTNNLPQFYGQPGILVNVHPVAFPASPEVS